GLAEDRLFAVVVIVFAEVGPALLDAPASEGPRRLANVLLGVVAAIGPARVVDAQAEQLHQLAGMVLVGPIASALGGVEPDHHRLVAGHLAEERAEAALGMPAHQLVLI